MLMLLLYSIWISYLSLLLLLFSSSSIIEEKICDFDKELGSMISEPNSG